MNLRLIRCAFTVALVLTLRAGAEVSLPKLFSSHMVLQRDMPIHVWGSAAAGEKITLELHGLTASASTHDAGRCSVYLPSHPPVVPLTLVLLRPHPLHLTPTPLPHLSPPST